MAYNDTLFQLGMDLTRSSTTQKEDPFAPAFASDTVQQSHDTEVDTGKTAGALSGNHLTADLTDIERLDDLSFIETTLKRCMDLAGVTPQHIHLYRFAPLHPSEVGGVAGVVMVEGGHLSLHSVPAQKALSIDVFLDTAATAKLLVGVVRKEFRAQQVAVSARIKATESGQPVQLLKRLRAEQKRVEPKIARASRAA
jgi:S-adenosylmethionine decarboxylase